MSLLAGVDRGGSPSTPTTSTLVTPSPPPPAPMTASSRACPATLTACPSPTAACKCPPPPPQHRGGCSWRPSCRPEPRLLPSRRDCQSCLAAPSPGLSGAGVCGASRVATPRRLLCARPAVIWKPSHPIGRACCPLGVALCWPAGQGHRSLCTLKGGVNPCPGMPPLGKVLVSDTFLSGLPVTSGTLAQVRV